VKFQAIVRRPGTISEHRRVSQPACISDRRSEYAGVVQIRGRKSLLEVLSLAGGLRQDSGNTITVTRQQEYGALGLRGEASDASGRYRRPK